MNQTNIFLCIIWKSRGSFPFSHLKHLPKEGVVVGGVLFYFSFISYFSLGRNNLSVSGRKNWSGKKERESHSIK